MTRFPRYRSIVRDAPVVAYTGANGAGKTLVAVSDACDDMVRGRRVISTVDIESPWGRSEPLRSLRQLLEIRDATVLIDEISAVFSSRATGHLPDDVVTFLQSMRHQKVTLRWTAPAFARADILVREVTQVCVPVFPVGRRRVPGSFWPRPLLIGASALDVTTLPVDKVPEKVVRGSRRLWVPTRLPGWAKYDTHADVSRIGWQRAGGRCLDCGGARPVEKCSVERHADMGIPLEGAADYRPMPSAQSAASVPIAASSAPEVQTVKPPLPTYWTTPGAERVPEPLAPLRLDGLDVAQ